MKRNANPKKKDEAPKNDKAPKKTETPKQSKSEKEEEVVVSEFILFSLKNNKVEEWHCFSTFHMF